MGCQEKTIQETHQAVINANEALQLRAEQIQKQAEGPSPSLQPDDQVLVRDNATDKIHTNRFSFKWTCPYKVDIRISEVIYKVKEIGRSVIDGVYHLDRLKIYYEREGSVLDS